MTERIGTHFSDCELQEYLDGRFSADDTRQISSHLDNCEECSARLAQHEALFKKIETLNEFEPGYDLSVGVVDTLEAERRSWAAGRWLLGVQALLALVVLFFSRALLDQLAGNEPTFDYLTNLDLVAWATGLFDVIIRQIDAVGSGLGNLVEGVLARVPSTSVGLNFWAIAAAGGVLWLVVHFSVVRSGRKENNGNGSE